MEFHFRYTVSLMSILLVMHISYMDDSLNMRKHSEWKKLILTHHWPVTVCKLAEVKCKNLPNYWTLHGLWPDKSQMCNNSWPFDCSEIQDILPEMNKCWPDLFHQNHSVFWKHEWQKHGTCAASLPCLNSQHNYFSKGLEMYSNVDLNSVLVKSGIKPSNTYQMKEIEDAIVNVYGVVPKIQCLPPQQGGDPQILGQIEICFSKDFKLINCTETSDEVLMTEDEPQINWKAYHEELHVCDNHINTFYPPVQ
ncbi:ribonuclease T2 [Pseudophryne corroboree]|uniref:ribonuclease T2 n=1 Tax=Pseudophryne corroboree TaxID=495146 RepID=UPI003081F4BC